MRLERGVVEYALHGAGADDGDPARADQHLRQQGATPVGVTAQSGLLWLSAGDRDHGAALGSSDALGPPRPPGVLETAEAMLGHAPEPLAHRARTAAELPGNGSQGSALAESTSGVGCMVGQLVRVDTC